MRPMYDVGSVLVLPVLVLVTVVDQVLYEPEVRLVALASAE